jgi:hypothetical protein
VDHKAFVPIADIEIMKSSISDYSTQVLQVYLDAAIWFYHHQVLGKEKLLKENYGEDYAEYRLWVRKFL